MAELHEGYSQAIRQLEWTQVIAFTRFNGEASQATFGDILTQVVYHGVYHRGQLSGSIGRRGSGDYPETDFLIFAMLDRGQQG